MENSAFMLVENMITDSYQIGKFFLIQFLTSQLLRRDEIIEVLKHRFAEKLQANLPIFGIEKSHLKDFTTTEKDMKKGQNRFPP